MATYYLTAEEQLRELNNEMFFALQTISESERRIKNAKEHIEELSAEKRRIEATLDKRDGYTLQLEGERNALNAERDEYMKRCLNLENQVEELKGKLAGCNLRELQINGIEIEGDVSRFVLKQGAGEKNITVEIVKEKGKETNNER